MPEESEDPEIPETPEESNPPTPSSPSVPDSILNTTKKLLNVGESYHVFDLDIIIHINSVFANIQQLMGGRDEAFQISGETEVWDDFIQGNKALAGVRSYVAMKVRLLFDPPSTSFALTSIEKLISEFEWRLNVEGDTPDAE